MAQRDDALYQRLFRASPGKILVLRPENFEIIAVTDEYLKATMTRADDLVGKPLLEVFPHPPDDSSANNVKALAASLQKVLAMKIVDMMAIQRHAIRQPSGVVDERFLSPVNSPVLDNAGEVEFIMHRVEDVTAIIKESNPESQTQPGDRLALQDIVVRLKESRQTVVKLQEHEARMRTAERLLRLGTWEFNPGTGNLNWSRQVFAIYDLPHGSSAPDFDKYFAMLHPDDRDAARAVYQRFFDDHAPQILFEHRVIARDGSTRHIKGVGERHMTTDGEIVVGYVQDITPLVITRDKLTQAEQLVRLAGKKAKLGGWRVELDTMAVFWTPETAAIHGMPADYSPPNVDQAIEFCAPEFRLTFESAFEHCAQQGEAFDTTCQLQCPDGRRPWVRAIGEAQWNDQGKIIAVQGAFQDISSLREAQLRADAEEQHRLDILESISDAFYALNRQWEFTYLNQQASAILGRSEDELIGKNIWTEFPGIRGSQIEEQYLKALQSHETVSFREFYQPLKKWFEISAYPKHDGLTVYFRDVTREHEDQERFKLISRATTDVLWDWDLTTDKVWWNDSITTVFGYALSELEPGSESWVNRIHPEDKERLLQSVYNALAGDNETWRGEFRFLRSGGKGTNVVGCGSIIRDENGKAVRMVGSMSDITERVEMEQRLRNSQKLEAIGHLTGGVAHDFNNLLTVIQGNTEMMAELATDPETKRMAKMTLAATARGSELTRRLLAFARRQPLAPKPTDLNQLVDAMWELIRQTLPENIELAFSPSPNLGIVEIDASELDTALLNLIVNARDAMPGGGKLTIETTNTVLDQQYSERHEEVNPGDYVMICVSDTGMGINPNVAQRVFEPFFTTKPVGKGSGLGLSMVFGFTKQSGGHISIYSEPNEGTSVKLYFPRVEGIQQTSYQPASDLLPEGGTEHILIAEDDALVLQHLDRQLSSLGYRVTAVTSGPEALEALATHKDFDLLLTDIVMPGGMNGRELADKVRETLPSLKVLFTSGYTENAIIHHGRLDAGVELLSKPYTRLELASKVRQVINKVNKGTLIT